jgi:cation:H+ antiporter
LSEFPEKVSAFHWARQIRSAPMALMNMVSSNINQWTMLIAMIPIVYSYGVGSAAGIAFDAHQKEEILLTLAQAFVGFMLLLNMNFSWYEAAGLFILWFAQFIQPHWRVQITGVYFLWFAIEVLRIFFGSRKLHALGHFSNLFKRYVLK